MPDDHQAQAARSDVLLRAGVDHAVLAHVHLLGEDHAAGVAHDGSLALRQFHIAGAVDRVVLGDVQVVRVIVVLDRVHVRHVGVNVVPAGSHHVHFAVALAFLRRQMGEVAAVDVVSLFVHHQVQRYSRELLGRAALQEYHVIILADIHQFPYIRHGLIINIGIHLAAVTHLHHGHTRIAVADQIFLCFFQYGQCKLGRSRGEVVYAFHVSFLLKLYWDVFVPPGCI